MDKRTAEIIGWSILAVVFALVVYFGLNYLAKRMQAMTEATPAYTLHITVHNHYQVYHQYNLPAPYKEKEPEKKKNIWQCINEIIMVQPNLFGMGINFNKAIEKAIA